MERILVIHGMKRSGNHGIIHWLEAHDDFVFFNNVIPISPILTGEQEVPAPEAFDTWLHQQPLTRAQGNYAAEEGEVLSLYRDDQTTRRSVIASLEDHELPLRLFYGAPCKVHHVLILRDPNNMLASRIRKASSVEDPAYPRAPGPNMDRILNLWKAHAREFLGQTRQLENKVCIYFNSWFSNPAYRHQISQQLGFEPTDEGFSRVSRIGGGSSFDGDQVADNLKLDVLNRQQYLSESERQVFHQVIADEELQELAREVARETQDSKPKASAHTVV